MGVVKSTKTSKCSLNVFIASSSAFQEADLVSSKDSGHGDSEQGDSDHDATNRGHSSGKNRLRCDSLGPACIFL